MASDPQAAQEIAHDLFLVCGLGSLGQHCVTSLRAFGARVNAIDKAIPAAWELRDLPNTIGMLVEGDCRRAEILERAEIRRCRAVLLTTGEERVNLEAAFAARLLNPRIRLVLRSSKENLAQLLARQLGNFVAFEATQLPAPAFTSAALGEETVGFFEIGEHPFRIVEKRVTAHDPWCTDRPVYQLNSHTRRILCHLPSGDTEIGEDLHRWDPEQPVHSGDTLIVIEAGDWRSTPGDDQPPHQVPGKPGRPARRPGLLRRLRDTWVQDGPRRVALISGCVMLLLLSLGSLVFWLAFPQQEPWQAISSAAILLLGGYGDVFGGLQPELPVPGWLRLFSLLLTLTGIALVGVIYGLITERLLSARFQFLARRPPVPVHGHIVLVGMGPLGQRVAELLQELHHPAVLLVEREPGAHTLPQLPMVVGNPTGTLERANPTGARSIITLTDDDLENLEIALLAHQLNPQADLVIRTRGQRFSDDIGRLFPYAHVLCANALTAEAFAGAAFGENILGLFRLRAQTVLVTEYHIEPGDTLIGLLIAEVAYGYGVIPAAWCEAGHSELSFLPAEDVRLANGDVLVVLATIQALDRIERGERRPPGWRVEVQRATDDEAAFSGGNLIAQICGCGLPVARELMERLPAVLPQRLYHHQAQRLVRELARHRVWARLFAEPTCASPPEEQATTTP